MTTLPWLTYPALSADLYQQVRLQTIFECYKWDPQVEDVETLARFPLVLTQESWQTLATLAEALTQETLALEAALQRSPALHQQLGLPKAITRLWQTMPTRTASPSHVRVMRYDFHFTTDGWQISEANTDVPGGYIESAGFTHLMARQYPTTTTPGDPAQTLAQAIGEAIGGAGLVALIHATAYVDDRQLMLYLAQALERAGLPSVLVSPAQIQWREGAAQVVTQWHQGPAAFLIRKFPAEWLINLPGRGWQGYFGPIRTPVCNPTTALLSQSKRLPLLWDQLDLPIPTWRRLLPPTCDPRAVPNSAATDWVFKPALGRVGEAVALHNVSTAQEWQAIQHAARRTPMDWVAQRRFTLVPWLRAEGTFYPCLGVYTVNGRAAGVYGRLSATPLVNALAQDVAVLVETSPQ